MARVTSAYVFEKVLSLYGCRIPSDVLWTNVIRLESERDRASVEASTLKRQIAALQTENDRAAQVRDARFRAEKV